MNSMAIFNHITTIFQGDNSRTVENIQRRQASKRLKKRVLNYLRDFLIVILGVFAAGFGLKGFLIPNGLIDGGVTGISLLINRESHISLSILILLLNIPFLLLGFRQISMGFCMKSIGSITALAIAVAIIPYPIITNDKILVAVFGGFFLGAGIGLVIRGGAVIDGTEVLAIYLSRKASLTVGDFIL